MYCGVYNRCRRSLHLHVLFVHLFVLVVISGEKSDKQIWQQIYQNTHGFNCQVRLCMHQGKFKFVKMIRNLIFATLFPSS